MIATENGGWVKGQGQGTPTGTGTGTGTTMSTVSQTRSPINAPSPTSGATNPYLDGSLGAMIGIAAFLMAWA
ncbi:4148_t:CDS:2 [Dentiscutata erythropus]|uniref:4148_t:CDS:1 n=1 Tax=Dentiscutata erythropus TaxID=1348616 RepID=A0A9N9AH01_9GLOM|nr:4148_t:CDS:2 [Dentiscutata erythropus]